MALLFCKGYMLKNKIYLTDTNDVTFIKRLLNTEAM